MATKTTPKKKVPAKKKAAGSNAGSKNRTATAQKRQTATNKKLQAALAMASSAMKSALTQGSDGGVGSVPATYGNPGKQSPRNRAQNAAFADRKKLAKKGK